MTTNKPRVLLVAEHASAKFGGEAVLPLHYFRVLRKRQVEVWLVVHERTRDELKLLLGKDFDRVYFVSDTHLHRLLWKVGRFLPHRLAYVTVGFVSRLLTQMEQRLLVRETVQHHQINLVHQPIPVSPKEPSLIFDVGAPVIIGPMNGGMNYPPSFQYMQSRFVHLTLGIGRLIANWLNWLLPGKRRAAALLVANARTHAALPKGTCDCVVELYENGVDLSIWQPELASSKVASKYAHSEYAHLEATVQPTKFVFVGRLVHWKAVDLLLIAFERVARTLPVELEIIGNGPESAQLQQQAIALGLLHSVPDPASDQGILKQPQHRGSVTFPGWLSQAECAQRLQQSDVMVLPSMLECGGAVVLESMAMGVPVIATNWGGPSEYLNESCGILIEPRSPELFIDDLAAAMIRMAASPALRRSMGQKGYYRAVSQFDWDVKADDILDIYRRLLSDSLVPRSLTRQNQPDPVISRV
ncbi:MAG: glycosyltransferase family 4 protein [Stenomitos rutilans HA7619-LM2]|jgi:glycosyltransferase involved in cell wall biosynthesis|nr:glycosyltransferase family 4 protein [Stenomitos rutilans HA7619-LM2]